MAKNSFYYPHDRSDTWWTGELEDPQTGEIYSPPSMTKQSFLAECDINNIIKQFKVTGMIQHMSAQASKGAYLDLPPPTDFQEALNTVLAAEDSFATLPSKIRARFDNDPQEFLVFMADPANQDEIISLGLGTDTRPPPPNPGSSQEAPPSPPEGKSGVQG